MKSDKSQGCLLPHLFILRIVSVSESIPAWRKCNAFISLLQNKWVFKTNTLSLCKWCNKYVLMKKWDRIQRELREINLFKINWRNISLLHFLSMSLRSCNLTYGKINVRHAIETQAFSSSLWPITLSPNPGIIRL